MRVNGKGRFAIYELDEDFGAIELERVTEYESHAYSAAYRSSPIGSSDLVRKEKTLVIDLDTGERL